MSLRRLFGEVIIKEVFPEDFDSFNTKLATYLEARIAFRDACGGSLSAPLVPKHTWLLHYGRLSAEMGAMAHVDTMIGEQRMHR